MPERPKFGEILVQAGAIDEMQLRAALGEQKRWGQRLGVTLVKMGIIEERELVRALARQLEIPVVQLEGKRVDREIIELVPVELAEKHMCVPLFAKEHGGVRVLYVGMEDPCNLAAIDDLSFRIGHQVQPVLVAPSELCEALDRFYYRAGRERTLSLDEPVGTAPREEGAIGDVPLEHESLFPALGAEGSAEEAGNEPEIPDDFGPAVAGAGPAAAASSQGDEAEVTERLVLRALSQLLIEKGTISRDELQERVRALQASEES